MKTKKTNVLLVDLVGLLKKESHKNAAPIWRDIAKRLERSRRLWSEVNVGHLTRVCEDGETIVVPGKLLGAGEIDKKLTVAAFDFSSSAELKIKEAGGKTITIEELVKANPKGSGVRIMG